MTKFSDHIRKRKKTLGNLGERLAACYLESMGWRILARNFRQGRSCEVDLIAQTPMRITVFVEVRTLTVLIGKELDWYETAAQSVDARKQRRIISAARRFRSENPYSCRSCRFDVVLVGITSRLSRSLTEQSEDANLNLQDCLNSPGLYIIHCPGAFMTNF